MTIQQIEKQKQALRKEYEERPDKRFIIIRQARALDIALELLLKRQAKYSKQSLQEGGAR